MSSLRVFPDMAERIVWFLSRLRRASGKPHALQEWVVHKESGNELRYY